MKIGVALQLSAAADTRDPRFEIVNAISRDDYDAWVAISRKQRGRFPNKESLGKWLRLSGLYIQAYIHGQRGEFPGFVPTPSAEWTWHAPASTVMARVT
jgi:hypothetical protein